MATMSARYTVIDGEVVAQERGGVRHQLVPDPLGSTVALYDSTGAKTDTFGYWPYGESSGRTGTTIAKFQFVGNIGYYQDSALVNYIRARYFHKVKNKWTSPDSIGYTDNYNLYIYVSDNPLRYYDLSGMKKQDPNLNPDDDKVPFPNHTRYCGSNHQCPPEKKPSNPIDCIDTACAEHDRCLYRLMPWAYPWLPPRYGVGRKYKHWPAYSFCAQKLCRNAGNCYNSGCDGLGFWDYHKCRQVALEVSQLFCKFFSTEPIVDIPDVPHSRFPR